MASSLYNFRYVLEIITTEERKSILNDPLYHSYCQFIFFKKKSVVVLVRTGEAREVRIINGE
jgi:hypothetical protein